MAVIVVARIITIITTATVVTTTTIAGKIFTSNKICFILEVDILCHLGFKLSVDLRRFETVAPLVRHVGHFWIRPCQCSSHHICKVIFSRSFPREMLAGEFMPFVAPLTGLLIDVIHSVWLEEIQYYVFFVLYIMKSLPTNSAKCSYL